MPESSIKKWDHSFPHREWEEVKNLQHSLQVIAAGKELLVDVSIASLLSRGHLLIEDVPGLGKSTFIKALGKLSGLKVSRIQCTSDMLPSDLIGSEMFDPKIQSFVFHEGPLFSEMVFIDELNRAPPKTQSALLEAMGEGQITVDKKTYKLPNHFIVFATQNFMEQYGTFPLPESQLDRFSAKIRFGYPDAMQEIEIFRDSYLDPLSKVPENVFERHSLQKLSMYLDEVHISEEVAQYVKRFVDATRKHDHIIVGVSTRGGLSWVRMAKGIALLRRREYLIPDDLQYTAICCLAHRISTKKSVESGHLLKELLERVQVR